MCGQGDDPTQFDRAYEPEPNGSGAHSTSPKGTLRVLGSVDGVPWGLAAEAVNAPYRGTFAIVDGEGAFIFLTRDELKGMTELFKDLDTIDRVFGTDRTVSPEWRVVVRAVVEAALEASSAT